MIHKLFFISDELPEIVQRVRIAKRNNVLSIILLILGVLIVTYLSIREDGITAEEIAVVIGVYTFVPITVYLLVRISKEIQKSNFWSKKFGLWTLFTQPRVTGFFLFPKFLLPSPCLSVHSFHLHTQVVALSLLER